MINKRIFHHLDPKEMTKKQHESLQIKRAEEKRIQKIEEEKKIVSELTEKRKYSWRSELDIDNITTGTH